MNTKEKEVRLVAQQMVGEWLKSDNIPNIVYELCKDYEQRYKESLDIARTSRDGFIKSGRNDDASKLEEMFPEIIESKDERIRISLIKWFKNYEETNEYFSIRPLLKTSEIIAWLEKQGEQKNTRCRMICGFDN